MKNSKEKKKKIRKVNKMRMLDMRSKIKQLLKTDDNSAYLRHLIQNAYVRHLEVLIGWIKNICKELGKSVSQMKMYLWGIIQLQDQISGYRLFDRPGLVLCYSAFELDMLYQRI